MPLHKNPVAWAGVVIVHEDGTTWAVQFDGSRQQITYELEETLSFSSCRTNPLGPVDIEGVAIDVRLRGCGDTWVGGAAAAPGRRRSIGEAPLAIEPCADRPGDREGWRP